MVHGRRHERMSVCVLLVAAMIWTSASYAGSMQIGNMIPGAGPVQVNVTNMREMHFINMVPQHTDFSCAAAALATILKYAYGRDVTELGVIRGLFQVSNPQVVRKKGFSMLDLKNYVEKLGYRGRGYKIKPELLDNIRIPVIVLLDIKGYKHFVVFKKATPTRVYIGDPALGNRVVPRKQFVANWNNIVFAVIGKGFERNTVLINPPQPMTERQLLTARAVISKAEMVEFGFDYADLF